MPELFEQRRALEQTLPEFEQTVRTGTNAHHHAHERAEPVVHQASETGSQRSLLLREREEVQEVPRERAPDDGQIRPASGIMPAP